MITKTVVRPYKGTEQWEADVFMLINGKEVRRRWRSPMPSKLATERWAREKARLGIGPSLLQQLAAGVVLTGFAERRV